jgi:arylformamidase
MKPEHVIELSHRLIPGKEHFKFQTHVDDVTKILPEVKHRADIWYILGEVTFCTHIGTHMEVPYHHQKNGADTATVPIAPLIAPGVVLDFSHKKPGETITLAEVKAHDHRIRKGDIVLVRQGADKFYYTDKWNDQCHLSIEANQWLIDKGIACLGTDGAGLEIPGTDYQPNHLAVCAAGVPMIESLRGLEQLGTERYLIVLLPLPFEGCDASPLRVVAIKKEGLKDMLNAL